MLFGLFVLTTTINVCGSAGVWERFCGVGWRSYLHIGYNVFKNLAHHSLNYIVLPQFPSCQKTMQ